MLGAMQCSSALTATWMLQSGRAGARAGGVGLAGTWAQPRGGSSWRSHRLFLQGPLLAARDQDAHTVRSQRGLLVSQRVCPSERGEC